MSPLHSEHGQGEGQQEVRDGQVKEEGVGQREGAGAAALRSSVASDHTQHQHVAHDSQKEHQGVHDGGVPLRKSVDVPLQAWRCAGPARFTVIQIIIAVPLGERNSHDLEEIVQEKLSSLFVRFIYLSLDEGTFNMEVL